MRRILLIACLIAVTANILGCRSLNSSLSAEKEGGRTGDPATFRNAELLTGPPDYNEDCTKKFCLKDFLKFIQDYEPTYSRMIQNFIENPATSFYRAKEECTHDGQPVRAYIAYPNNVLLCSTYWTASDRDKLRVLMHEMTHWVYYTLKLEEGNEETNVITMEQELANVYDQWLAKDLPKAVATLKLLRQKQFSPNLARLATVADLDQDLGKIKAIPILRDHPEITYPVLESILSDKPPLLLPDFYEVNINRLWSRGIVAKTIAPGQDPYKAAALLKLLKDASEDQQLLNHPLWDRGGLLFPREKEIEYIKDASNIGVPHYLKTLPRSQLSKEFLLYLERLKSYGEPELIRTLFHDYLADAPRRGILSKIPNCEPGNYSCMDFVIFFKD